MPISDTSIAVAQRIRELELVTTALDAGEEAIAVKVGSAGFQVEPNTDQYRRGSEVIRAVIGAALSSLKLSLADSVVLETVADAPPVEPPPTEPPPQEG